MMLGRIDCDPHRDRRRDTDAEMAIGSAKRYRQARQGSPRPWGRHRPSHEHGLISLAAMLLMVVTRMFVAEIGWLMVDPTRREK
jgi:hypothetical protein